MQGLQWDFLDGIRVQNGARIIKGTRSATHQVPGNFLRKSELCGSRDLEGTVRRTACGHMKLHRSSWGGSQNIVAHLCMALVQINEPRGADGIEEVRKAYEFTLEKIGSDTAAGPLWQEYIAFLQVTFLNSPVPSVCRVYNSCTFSSTAVYVTAELYSQCWD